MKAPLNTPYTRIGPNMVDMGFSAIPVLPGAKFPGGRAFGEWVAENNWQRFCDRLPTEYETAAWSTWPDAGVCVALGVNDVVAVDIDTVDPDITAAILDVIGPSPVAKRGAKGQTLFYRANVYRVDAETGEVTGAVKSKFFDIRRERVLDLLSHGRQTVVPPSVHPDTGREYEWLTDDTLADTPPEKLPMLPDDVADQLAKALEPFGYIDIPDYTVPKRGEEGDEDTPWKEVNRLARENFDAWVPALCLPATKRNGRGTYRAAAVWRGGDGPNVSFHPKGIKDMVTDQSLSALDVVMLATSSSLDAAFRWLGPRVGYKPPTHINFTAILENGKRKWELAQQAAVNEELVAVAPAPTTSAQGDTLDDLTHPGGLLEDLVDWITSSSPTPSRPLALSAVIPLLGAMIGRRFSTGTHDTRTNIYTVALAESGFGKEHARSQIKRLFIAGQGVFDVYSGPARIMSHSALREVLEKTPCVNCMIDEFGGFVKEITDKKAGAHQRGISTDLRDYYSASSTFFEGAAYRGAPAQKIENPMLCIYGTSTPDQFWSALNSASAEDGLLPRILLFNVKGSKPQEVAPKRDIRDVPHGLLERMAKLANIDVASTRLGDVQKRVQAAHDRTQVVPWDNAAQERFAELRARVQDEEALVVPEARPFVRRIVETATKLALIAAASVDPKQPIVTGLNMDWAARLAWLCASEMIVEVSDRMADNLREANYKRIESIIRKAGKEGIARGRLGDRLKSVDARQREEILADLLAAEKVAEHISGPGKAGRPKGRLVWVG